jgi:hypothetical protein
MLAYGETALLWSRILPADHPGIEPGSPLALGRHLKN